MRKKITAATIAAIAKEQTIAKLTEIVKPYSVNIQTNSVSIQGDIDSYKIRQIQQIEEGAEDVNGLEIKDLLRLNEYGFLAAEYYVDGELVRVTLT